MKVCDRSPVSRSSFRRSRCLGAKRISQAQQQLTRIDGFARKSVARFEGLDVVASPDDVTTMAGKSLRIYTYASGEDFEPALSGISGQRTSRMRSDNRPSSPAARLKRICLPASSKCTGSFEVERVVVNHHDHGFK